MPGYARTADREEQSAFVSRLQKAIAARGLKQSEAAEVLRVTQPRVSDLLRGRINLFSTDALVDMLAKLGIGVRLVVKTPRSRKVA